MVLGSVARGGGHSQASLCRYPGSSNTADRELERKPGSGSVHPPKRGVFAKEEALR